MIKIKVEDLHENLKISISVDLVGLQRKHKHWDSATQDQKDEYIKNKVKESLNELADDITDNIIYT